ncbi:cell wall lytic activity [Desulfosporosinus sp. I2]|nr:cell wall lytic activity [Desulfosporosinus sp. I2]
MTKIYSKTITPILGTIISAFLFVSIITTFPATITSDQITPEIQAANEVLANVDTKVPETPTPTPEASTTNPPTSNPVPASQPKTSTPVKKAQTQPSRSSTSTSQSGKASAIIATSQQYIGVKYVFGGTTPAGFDCSGFVQYVFAKNGISLPRVSRDQYKVGTSVSFSNLQPGDLVFFSLGKNGVVDHDGIYIGNGQFINAASSKGVTIYTLGTYWKSAYVGAKRVL